MGYKVEHIALYKEESFNVAPTTPKVLKMKTTSFDLKEQPRSKTSELLGNGHEPTSKIYGTSDYNGNVGFNLGGAYLPFLCEGVIGAATTVENATTSTHSATTSYAQGDMVNHSNGMNTLVCYKAGTSGTDEPEITTEDDGDTLIDDGVTWIVRPLLKRRVGKLDACTPSFAIERKDTASCSLGEDHYEIFTGLTMDSLTLKKEGGEIDFEVSPNLQGLGHQSTFDEGTSYTPLVGGTVLPESFYGSDDLDTQVSDDGITWTSIDDLDTLELTIQRQNEIKDTQSGKRVNQGKITISGNSTGLMNKALYEKTYLNFKKHVRFVYSKVNGDKSIVRLTQVEFEKSSKNIAVGEDIMLDVPLNASGTPSISAVYYECITAVEL